MRIAVNATRTHLQAASFATLIAGAVVAVLLVICERAEHRYIYAFAPELSDVKLQGVALQKAAFQQPDLLVLYGSSELVKEVPNRATDFFSQFPTGFRVFPVGKAGTISLANLLKLAAVGDTMRGKKVALSISPSFFFTEKVNEGFYEGNFSPLQAQELAFSSALSQQLKHDAARRMRQYSGTTDGNWLLDFTLDRLACNTALDRALYGAVWPLGKLSNAVGRAQDHIEAGLRIIESDGPDAKPEKLGGVNWKEVLRRASQQKALAKDAKLAMRPKGSRDASFIAALTEADEWDDFVLVLRTLRELGAQPMLLSMPLHGADLEITGVSAKARHKYGEKLTELASRYNMELVYFQQFEEDPTFFADHLDHPGSKGWVLYDKALDDFFHRNTN